MNLLSQPVARSSFITNVETDIEDYLTCSLSNITRKERIVPLPPLLHSLSFLTVVAVHLASTRPRRPALVDQI